MRPHAAYHLTVCAVASWSAVVLNRFGGDLQWPTSYPKALRLCHPTQKAREDLRTPRRCCIGKAHEHSNVEAIIGRLPAERSSTSESKCPAKAAAATNLADFDFDSDSVTRFRSDPSAAAAAMRLKQGTANLLRRCGWGGNGGNFVLGHSLTHPRAMMDRLGRDAHARAHFPFAMPLALVSFQRVKRCPNPTPSPSPIYAENGGTPHISPAST